MSFSPVPSQGEQNKSLLFPSLPLNFQIKNTDLLSEGVLMFCREITQMRKTRERDTSGCVIAWRPASPQGCHQYLRKLIRQQPPPTFAIWGLALLTLPCARVCSSSLLIHLWMINMVFHWSHQERSLTWGIFAQNKLVRVKLNLEFNRCLVNPVLLHWGPKAALSLKGVHGWLESGEFVEPFRRDRLMHETSNVHAETFPTLKSCQTWRLLPDSVGLSVLCVFSNCCDHHKVPLARRYHQEAFGPTPESQDSRLCTQGAACAPTIKALTSLAVVWLVLRSLSIRNY